MINDELDVSLDDMDFTDQIVFELEYLLKKPIDIMEELDFSIQTEEF